MPTALTRAAMRWSRWQDRVQPSRRLIWRARSDAEAAPAASAGANTGHPKRTPRVRLGKPVRGLRRKMRQPSVMQFFAFYAWAERYLSRPNFRSARTTRQRIFAAVVQPMDGVVIESLISDVHPGMERWVCGKFFDREADGLSGGPKTSISDRPSTALAAFHE